MNMASHGWGCERYGWHAFEQPLGSQTVLWCFAIWGVSVYSADTVLPGYTLYSDWNYSR